MQTQIPHLSRKKKNARQSFLQTWFETCSWSPLSTTSLLIKGSPVSTCLLPRLDSSLPSEHDRLLPSSQQLSAEPPCPPMLIHPIFLLSKMPLPDPLGLFSRLFYMPKLNPLDSLSFPCFQRLRFISDHHIRILLRELSWIPFSISKRPWSKIRLTINT